MFWKDKVEGLGSNTPLRRRYSMQKESIQFTYLSHDVFQSGQTIQIESDKSIRADGEIAEVIICVQTNTDQVCELLNLQLFFISFELLCQCLALRSFRSYSNLSSSV